MNSKYQIEWPERFGPLGTYHVICLSETLFDENGRPQAVRMVAEFGNAGRPESLKYARLVKAVLDIDKDALRRQYEMASKLSEHLSSEDYEVFTGLLHLIEELLI
jgi:hypothetical protein